MKDQMPLVSPVERSAGIFAEVVTQPERLEAIAVAVEFAPGVALHVARRLIATEQIDRAVAVGPHMERAFLARLGTVAGFGIDIHHRPGAALGLSVLVGDDIGERAQALV